MSSANRVLVEISPYSLQLAVVSGRRLVARGDYPLDAKEALAEFLATHQAQNAALVLISPKQPAARVAGEESGSGRTDADLLAAVLTPTTGLTPPVSVVACDAITGKTFDSAMKGSVLLSGAMTEALETTRDQLGALGLSASAARTGLALPSQLGAVVAALQDMSESTRVAVLALGENDSVLALVSAAGVEAVQTVAIGYGQIFEAVKAELGLKFRAAAAKLFFNAGYDFTDAADKIGARLAPSVQAALQGFSNRPTALQVVGLPEQQAWFGRSFAQALALTNWAPDMAKICAQLGLEVSGGSAPTANALNLVQLAATDDLGEAAWLPRFIGERPAPVSAPAAPAPAPAIIAAPVAVKAPDKIVSSPAPRAAAVPASKPVAPAPQPNKLPPKPPLKAVATAAPAPKAVQSPAPAPALVQPQPVKEAPKPVAPVARPSAPVVVDDDQFVSPAVPPKRPVALYGIIAAVVLIAAVGVGVKVHMDSGAKALAVQQAADEARLMAEKARKLALEKAEAAFRINPATGLPGAWISTGIGAGITSGSAGFSQGAFNLSGFGRDIGVTKDGFMFTYVPMSGDGSITARFAALTGATRVAKLGLMLRGNLNENSAHVSLLIENGGKNLKTVWREKTGVKTAIFDSSGNTVMGVPIWLRLVRAGNTITAYQSDNGGTWSLVPGTPITLEMPDAIYAGLAVCSREDNPTVTTVDHVSVPGWDSSPAILAGAAR